MNAKYDESEADAVQLRLWSEAGRHLDLQRSLPVLAQQLAAALPFTRLQIDERGADGRDLLRLGEWSIAAGAQLRPKPRGLSRFVMRQLQDWAQTADAVALSSSSAHAVLFDEWREDRDGAALLGALHADGEWIGVLRLDGIAARALSPELARRFRTMLAPLAAALANDRRLRELERLGAAAEADRASLLTRLGRKSLTESIVGADRGLRRVMERVDQVAPTDATVVILGETGAGKEVIARAIHERSVRAEGPFVRVNCGAVPPDLIDSELFGHEKGAFTGALAARRGWFERADGGTLFLDEIGELTPSVQIRLLRVLQDGIVQRVGSERDIAVNVRVIAATHRDLPGMVQDGRFREDLWYRLAVFPVILPPLRERPEDIPQLARHFVQRAANRLGVPVPPLHDNDIEHLLRYRWPGNVRELAAVIERAVILGQGQRLDLETALGVDVPRQDDAAKDRVLAVGRAGAPAIDSEEPLSLDAVIVAHLQKVLRSCGGRVDGPHGAAQKLGVNTSTLRAKLRKHRIDPRAFRR